MSGATSAYGTTVIADGVSVPAAFALEVLGTFLMINAILHCAVKGKAGNLAPIAIAFTVGACIMADLYNRWFMLASDGEDSKCWTSCRGRAGRRSRRYGRRHHGRHPLQDGGPSP